ncbi:hypothetical protein A5819_002252 [Enterococcus sp. 7E2_DIV0204]|uniref:MucBP domain-containing protein n=1 Tax=Candidatus Enterococcus lemimoniae TaxID=1834167 RepID=A0ABZ2T415_9ENTE|nr:hypothetical protein A5819_002252 [Enterococcus sp. 7E2_DIV0204]
MTAPEVGGYELDTSKLPTNESGQYDEGFIQVSFYYKKKLTEGIVDVYCFDESGNIIAEYPNSDTGVVGSTYTVSAPEVSGYELDTSKLPANESGQYNEGFIQVSYYYKKKMISDIIKKNSNGNSINNSKNSNVLKNEQPKKILENRIIPKMGEETNFSYIFLGVMILLSLSFYYRKDKDTK